MGMASGTVTFRDGSTVLGTVTLVNGVATFSTSSLSMGSHSITAIYNGDTNDTGSTSGVVTENRGVPDSGTHDVDTVDGIFLALSPWAVRNLRFDAKNFLS